MDSIKSYLMKLVISYLSIKQIKQFLVKYSLLWM
nr:MAG TPA: hypothetical protein [Caudoviricetes sp.]